MGGWLQSARCSGTLGMSGSELKTYNYVPAGIPLHTVSTYMDICTYILTLDYTQRTSTVLALKISIY